MLHQKNNDVLIQNISPKIVICEIMHDKYLLVFSLEQNTITMSAPKGTENSEKNHTKKLSKNFKNYF